MMVRFCTTCDRCHRRSEEYTKWPTCRECGEDVCPDCDVEDERSEDEQNETVCRKCAKELDDTGEGEPIVEDEEGDDRS